MSQSTRSSTSPAPASLQQPDGLYDAAAWVAIIAGLLLIVVSILSVAGMVGCWL
ncbi:hypothetical protein [Mycobacterium sp.]|uniref:hypothetical protein n=1 Tax=Mycobacterium sp. TaxID=1785 RepID=UPI0025E0EF45|nr:hypothetical protein [Mycobacterium sp.]